MTRSIIVGLILIGFFGMIAIVLFGFVNVEQPEIAKFVGALFGYLSSIVQSVVVHYFRETPDANPKSNRSESP